MRLSILSIRARPYAHRCVRAMTPTRLPVSRCSANCTKCGLPTDYEIFESGVGGDFATYVGVTTGNTYRLNLANMHYSGKTIDESLSPALEREPGGLKRMPGELTCKICGNRFSALNCIIVSEEQIDAYEL